MGREGSLAIIGGTGLTALEGFRVLKREMVTTPWGDISAPLVHGDLAGSSVFFIARHGEEHNIPPHRVNYRANLWALREAGVRQVVAVAAVGGIAADAGPGRLVFPDQLIDYTWSREHTYFSDDLDDVVHIDFTQPYCETLRDALIDAARELRLDALEQGTYGATQGPRLETAAEIDRMERDGCDIVGMTGMPEAALARELELCYATCAVVANPAAGRGEGPIGMDEIQRTVAQGMTKVHRLLSTL